MTYPWASGDVLTAANLNAAFGLVLVTESSFTTTNTVNVSSCFSSTFSNYRVIVTLTAQSGNQLLYFRYRSGSTNNTSSLYDLAGVEYATGSASITFLGSMGADKARLNFCYATPGYATAVLDITNPYAAAYTSHVSNSLSVNSTTAVLVDELRGFYRGTTSFDGISFGLYDNAALTISGKVAIYGYGNP